MWWKKKKKTEQAASTEPLFPPEDLPSPTPADREAYRRIRTEYLATVSPEELKRREEQVQWEKELQEKIANGEATVIRGPGWEQIIVDGQVVEFRDGVWPAGDGKYTDM